MIAPDLAFYRAERAPTQEALEADFLRVPPDAVVEVLSPSNRQAEVEEKVLIYLGAGVPLVLVANPQCETVSARTPDGRERIFGSEDVLDLDDVLPGFRIPVARFFRR